MNSFILIYPQNVVFNFYSEYEKIAELERNFRIDSNVMKFITTLSNGGIVWIVLAIILLCVKKTRIEGVMLSIGLGLHVLTCNVLVKNLVRRPRPYEEIEGLVSLLGKLSDYSFPSGHTTVTFMVAIILIKRYPKYIGSIVYGIALLTGFSRMYLGVHYLTDILGGVVLGTTIGLLAIYIGNKCCENKREDEILKKN